MKAIMPEIDFSPQEKPVKKGDILRLIIESTGFEGKSIARYRDFVIFLPFAAPGDEAEAEITRVRSSWAEGKILALIKKGPDRVDPVCRHFGDCGGCKWQGLSYPAQLSAKHQQVTDAIQRTGGFENPNVLPILGTQNPFHYRNKMDFTFSDSPWLTKEELASGAPDRNTFALGLHVPGRFDKVVDLTECHIQQPVGNTILNLVRRFSIQHQYLPYSSKTHSGFLRNLIIRHGVNTGDLMVILVTFKKDDQFNHDLTQAFKNQIPAIKSFINVLHSGKGPVPKGEGEFVLFGSSVLTEQLLGIQFTVHPNSFFQTNTKQAERLFESAFSAAGLSDTDVLYDLFCGPGTIGLLAARRVKQVVGIELVPEAVENARENARKNGIQNAVFFQGDMGSDHGQIKTWELTYGKPDIIVVDPPRAGMTEETCRFLPTFGAPKILYISCNPMTLARDLKILASFNYELSYIQPVDMFPHTFHIECIVLLTKRTGL